MDYLNELENILKKDWDLDEIQFPCSLAKDFEITKIENDTLKQTIFSLIQRIQGLELTFSRLILENVDDSRFARKIAKKRFRSWIEAMFVYLKDCSIQMKYLGYEQIGMFAFERQYKNGSHISVTLNALKGTTFAIWKDEEDLHHIQDSPYSYYESLMPSLEYFEKEHMDQESFPYMSNHLRDLVVGGIE